MPDQIREQLLWVFNRGAAVLIADLTGTPAIASARMSWHVPITRADANRVKLRLVVIADVVRRVLSLKGLDRLVVVYWPWTEPFPHLWGSLIVRPAPKSC